jgi:hypothetical protein
VVDHTIPLLNDSKPVNQRPYRLPHYQKAILEDLITKLVQAHMIKPSMSPYSSPVILVRKKGWNLENMCRLQETEFKRNQKENPIPVIEYLLDEVFGATIFSKIGLRAGYHQIRMHDQNIHKTAFTTHMGHFEYMVMPFGLTNAPATFSHS